MVSSPCSVLSKFVQEATSALHSTTSMDSMALIAWNLLQEKSASSCLVPLRVGRISKRTRDRSLGRRVGTLMGSAWISVDMRHRPWAGRGFCNLLSCSDGGWARPLLLLLPLAVLRVTGPLQPRDTSAEEAGGGSHDLPNILSPEDQLLALMTWTSQFKFGEPPNQMQTQILEF